MSAMNADGKQPCPAHEPDLSAFLDGELPSGRQAEIASHVAECAPCNAALTRLRRVSDALRRWDADETRYAHSPGFRGRVLDRLDEGAPVRELPVLTPRSRWSGADRFAAAAAVLACVALGMAWRMEWRTPTDPDVLARLSELEARQQALRTQSAPTPSGGALAEVRPSSSEAWLPIVSDAAPVAIDDGLLLEGPPAADWEARGDIVIETGALSEFERFERDKRLLAIEQKQSELDRAEPRPTESGTESGSATAAADAPPPLAAFLAQLSIPNEAFETYRDVQVWPIVAPGTAVAGGDAPLTTGPAVRSGILRVRESSIPAMDGVVRVENRDRDRPVLVVAGDVFRGGKQDRVAAVDVLIPPGRAMHVRTQMSGSERTRGRTTFGDAPGLAPSGLRALLAAEAGQYRFDQGVRSSLRGLAQENRYGSIEKLYRSSQLSNKTSAHLKRFEDRLDRPDVIGFAVAVGSELLGVEVFGDRATFEEMHGRALKSYVLEALSRDKVIGSAPPRREVEALLANARRGVVRQETPSGLGSLGVIEDLRSGVFGYGLRHGTSVVHAIVFPRRPSGTPGPGARRGDGPSRTGLEAGGRTPDAPSAPGGSSTPTGPSLNENE